MAWEYPVGHEDPMNAWENEEFAYDEDIDTIATSVPLPNGVWTGYLIFDFPPSIGRKFQCRVNCPTARYSFEVEAGDGVEWRRWITVGNTSAPYAVNLTLLPIMFSQVRIRWRHLGPGWAGGELNSLRVDRVCHGPLVAICGFLGQTSEFFVDLADDIEGVLLVGDSLAAPFVALSNAFQTAKETCCIASAALQAILDALESGITAEALLLLIQDHWPTLYYLITDPVDWFLVQLTLAFNLDPWNTQSLEFLAKWVLEEYFPVLYRIWLDPEDWLSILLEDRFPVLYYLITDPVGEILYLIGQAFDLTPYEAQSGEFIIKALFERWFPELYLLAYDPERWLREHVLAIIEEFTEDVGAFLENAWGWLLDQYEDAFESIQAKLYGLAERTLRFFWEGLW